MVDVSTSIVIDLAPERVREFVAEPRNAPKWYVNIKKAELLTPLPLRQGSKASFEANFMGRTLAYTYEFTEVCTDRIVMRTAEGPFPMETTYAFEKLAEQRTRMNLRNRGEPKGFSKIMAPLMSFFMRRANNKDLLKLKLLLEKRPA